MKAGSRKGIRPAAWIHQQRALFISDHLERQGEVKRRHIMRHFLVTEVTATQILRRYRALYPGRIYYDPHRRAYVPVEQAHDA